MKYKAKVNDKYDFEFTKKEIHDLDSCPISKNRSHILYDHTTFQVEITSADIHRKIYSVKIDSQTYDIEILDELDILIEEMGLSLGAEQTVNDIKAPMPGLILDVNVKEGDEVKEGDFLLVLEAMKMENALSAPRDGKVKSVLVKKGETVEKNQLLVEME